MTSNEPDNLQSRGRNLEEEYFRREDQRLLEQLKQRSAADTAREALAKASGITNPTILDKLLRLDVRAETVAVLSVVPLLEVAWADGSLDAKEREAVLNRARESGVAPDSAEHVLLEAGLDKRPEARLLTAWTHLVQGMCEQLAPAEIEKLRTGLLDRARAVASASGGVLGLGSKISGAESAMLTKLERAFRRAE